MADFTIPLIPDDPSLRSDSQNRLPSSSIDATVIRNQYMTLAVSNGLLYLCGGPATSSSTNLIAPTPKYFNSRYPLSFANPPFSNGLTFVFQFSNQDYGYYSGSQSANLYWQGLESDPQNKVLSLSQINSKDVANPVPNYKFWEFNVNSILFVTASSFTMSYWRVTTRKVMGPTFTNFDATTLYSVSYRSTNGASPSGGSFSQGESGPQGETGPQGQSGPQGETGPIGETGPQGQSGPQGETGPIGESGPQGFTGPQGPVGATGSAGTQLQFQSTWTSSALYGIDEYVTYGGSTWFTTGGASAGVPPSPTNSNWTLFSGAALIVGTDIPVSSSSVGSKGEIRVNNGEYLYIHTGAQWLKSSMTFSTF